MKNTKNKNKKGFTLVETMITVTIVGALSAIALPAYQDYVIKSQVAESFVIADEVKKEVELQKTLSDRFNPELIKNLPSGVELDEGNILVFIKDKNKVINNKLVVFYLDETAGTNAFRWNCITDLPQKYLPSSIDCLDESKIDGDIDKTVTFDSRDYLSTHNTTVLGTVDGDQHLLSGITFYKYIPDLNGGYILEELSFTYDYSNLNNQLDLTVGNQRIAYDSNGKPDYSNVQYTEDKNTLKGNDIVDFINSLSGSKFNYAGNDYKVEYSNELHHSANYDNIVKNIDFLKNSTLCQEITCNFK